MSIPIQIFAGRGVAVVVGVVRPAVYLNASLISGLTPMQLEQVLAHEFAHVFRWDPATQLAQRVIESWLYFHPAVWYVSSKVSDLRELSCDEWVADAYDRFEYAETLVHCASVDQFVSSEFALAATGSHTSQLTNRVNQLLDSQVDDRSYFVIHRKFQQYAAVVSVTFLLCLAGSLTYRTSTPYSSQSFQEKSIEFVSNSSWNWKMLAPNEIKYEDFVFGGETIKLDSNMPRDVRIAADLEGEFCQIGQWHFGDSASTRIAVVVDRSSKRRRIFLDVDRNRTIEPNEEAQSIETNGHRFWIAEVPVEVHEGGKTIRSNRQIVVMPRQNQNELKISTCGCAVGSVRLGGKNVRSKRVDRDGNGIPNDVGDQIWLDLNQDGRFDRISEQYNMNSSLDIEGNRYSIRTDRLGQTLLLTPNQTQGKLQFEFSPTGIASKTVLLEGALRDENGLFIAIRLGSGPMLVPVGRYRIESLVVEVQDSANERWRLTMIARSDQLVEFDVAADELTHLKLLESLDFSGKVVSHAPAYQGHTKSIEPFIYTNNGLVVTNFMRVSSGDEPTERMDSFEATSARFQLVSNVSGDKSDIQCSGFN